MEITANDNATRVYVRGFDSLRTLGQLNRIPPKLAYEMFDTVAQEAPETAAQMEALYDGARVEGLSEIAAASTLPVRAERQKNRLTRTAMRAGLPVASILRVQAGGHDREFVEARAALYRS